jgi:ATP-binding cassette subfamily B (MDR/TAP) protein 1
VFLIGDVIDAFGPTVTPEEALRQIEKICIIFVGIGLGILLFGYIFYAFLLIFSERVAKRTRIAYLRAIIKQEVAWFDMRNYQELTSRISKEIMAI